jgi:Tol biopolymer transport system component
MTLQRIGPYPIEREVGRGGMGVVYLGRDTRLDRPVAIKVLPDVFARDPDRLARFEREARLLASLTHPNIAGIYGLEEADGKRCLVLEYVEGETLAERLRRGPLPLEETLDACRQIAAALEAAHEAGIVHRDLKPGNVKLVPTGEVKVLDFGLAKGAASTADSNPDLSQSPTVTQGATGVGVVLGTAAYMSPEQARGRTVDRRTDIWSFGCVLYECLTGEQAFAGETVSDMIALILQGEPDWSGLPARTPEKLRALLGRCLEKDAKRRLRDIGDARIEIEELQGARISGAARTSSAVPAAADAGRRAGRGPRIAFAAALVLAGALVGAALWDVSGRGRTPAPPLRFMLQAPPRVTLTGDPNEHAISHDGRTLAFVAVDSAGQGSLWLRPLGSFEARELSGTRNADLPFWSPDDRQIGFFADNKLKRIRLSGGSPEVICDAPSGRGASWSGKGVIVFAPAPGGPLFQIRASGGTPTAVTVLDTANGETAHRWPCFLPDGEHFTYAALPVRSGDYRCYVGSTRSMARTPLLAAAGAPLYATPGHLVFVRGEALLGQRFDTRRLELVGEPFSIGDPPAGTIFSGSPRASVSTNGVLAWQSAGKLDTRLIWVDRSGRQTGSVDIPLDRWTNSSVSPDGRRAMVEQNVASGNADLWVVDLQREVANRLTFEAGRNTVGAWSRDGREIAFGSTRRGTRDLYLRAADGSGADRPLYQSGVPFKDPTDWSPDGRWIVMQQNGDRDGWNLWILPAAGGEPKPYLVTPFNESYARVTGDGKWAVYISDESGTPQAYVQTFPTPGRKQQVSKTGALVAMWSAKDSEILLLRPDLTMASVAVEWGAEPSFGTPRELFRLDPTWITAVPTADGQRFLVTVPAVRTVPGISVAVNWRAGREP